MEFGLKWIYMARYELILRLDGALWLRIIFKTPPDPQKGHGIIKILKQVKNILELAKITYGLHDYIHHPLHLNESIPLGE